LYFFDNLKLYIYLWNKIEYYQNKIKMKSLFTFLAFFLLQNLFAQYQLGHASFDFPDPARANRSVWGEVYYPATVAGDNKPVATGQFPVIVFGHGFATVYSEYSVWWENLVPEGYIMVFPRTEGNLFSTNHENFAKDLSFLVTKYKSEGTNSASIFYQKLNNKFGAMGHSMGGGCSVYVAATNADVTTLCTLAAIETNAPVSAKAFAPTIAKPSLMLAGSADCVANSSQSAGSPLSIYTPAATAPYKAYVEITGASHCQFGIASFGSNCTQGENPIFNSACSGITFMPKNAQHTQMLLTSKPWLNYWLKGNNCADWTLFKNDLYNNTAHTFQEAGAVSTGVSATISTPGNPSICQGQNITMSATGGSTYLWSNGNTSPNITVNQAGTYNVTVTGSNGCTATSSKIISVSPAPTVSISPSGSTSFCQGGNVTLTANGGSSYVWSNGSNSPFITAISAGNYSVVVTNSNGCTASTSINVFVNSPPTATISGNTTICQGQNTTLFTSGGVAYLWSNNSTQNNISVSQSGTYTVTITDGNGCKNSTSTSVTASQNPTAAISLSSQNPLCEGENLTLTASGGTSYLWSNATSQNLINVSQSGTYVVTVTDGNGCTATNSKAVTFNPKPIATINSSSNTPLCEGANLTLTASGGTSYLWSNSTSQNLINVSQSGTYVVTVTNGNGCSATSSKAVIFNPKPIATINSSSNTPLCEGENLTLTANGGTSYLWSNAASQNLINISQSGTYVVTVTNGNGCSATSSKVVTFNPKPTAAINSSSNTPLCEGENLILTASGGTSYLWSNATSQNLVNVSQSGTYVVTVTNGNGCSATSSKVVTFNPKPTATINSSSNTPLCEGENLTLTASGGTSYLWSNAASQNLINVSQSGTYVVTVTNGNGCSATSSKAVTFNPKPTAAINSSSNTPLCEGENLTLTASGGTSYLWSNAASQNLINVSQSGTYVVTVTNGNGCSATSSKVVTFNPKPTAAITSSSGNVICEGESLVLTASQNATYLWSTAATSQNITVSKSGVYTVTVTNLNGCTSVASQTITVNPSAMSNITASGSATICKDDSLTLTASGGVSYFWSTNTSNPSIVVKKDGTYTVTVTNSFGCKALASQTVKVLVLTTPNILSAGPKMTCDQTAFSYQWYLDGKAIVGATSKDYIAQKSGKYSVEIKNKEGCSAISSPVQIEITSIQEVDNQIVSVFPNPTSNSFFIKINQKAKATIFDVLGKNIYEEKTFFQEKEIQTSHWQNGIYFIVLETENGVLVRKLEKI
jgi:dienelactone hydrolase